MVDRVENHVQYFDGFGQVSDATIDPRWINVQ